MKRIALIGGSGFIGLNLIEELSQHYDFTIFGRGENSEILIGGISVSYKKLNIQKISHQLKGYDAVVNLASKKVVSVESFNSYTEDILLADSIMNACIDEGITFIQLSSRLVYSKEQALPWREETLDFPDTMYGISKSAIDRLLLYYNNKHGVNFISLRCAQVFGLVKCEIPSDQTGFIINKFVANCIQHMPLTIHGEGTGSRDYVYIKDICHAIALSIESNESGIFNIGSGRTLNYIDLAHTIRDVFKSNSEIVFLEDKLGDTSRTLLDISKAKTRLNYFPKYTFYDAINDMKEILYGT